MYIDETTDNGIETVFAAPCGRDVLIFAQTHNSVFISFVAANLRTQD